MIFIEILFLLVDALIFWGALCDT